MADTIKLNMGTIEDVIVNLNNKRQNKEKTILEKDLPQKVKYRLARIFDKMEREMKIYAKLKEDEALRYCIKKDGEPMTGQNGEIRIDPQYQQALGKKIIEMRDEEVDMGLEPIVFDLEGKEAEGLSVEDIMLLLKMKLVDGE